MTFNRLWYGATIASVLLFTGVSHATDEALALENAFVRIAEDVGPAVVSIAAVQDRMVEPRHHPDPFLDNLLRQLWGRPTHPLRFQRRGLGSGMIINEEGDILTNTHVVKGADRIEITLPDGRVYTCEIRGADVRSDLAVIRIIDRNDDDPPLPHVTLGNSDTVRPGQWSIAIGNPFGITEGTDEQPTVTVGVISAVRTFQTPTRDFNKMIQTDAAINPGNSGGPLCNIRGEVIGVNTFIVSSGAGQSAGVGFAIPINRAKAIIADLREGRAIRYGWLGIEMQEVTRDISEFFGRDDTSGVLVRNVLTNAPAADAGIKPGDLIISINEQLIRDPSHLVAIVTQLPVDTPADVRINREGDEQTISVVVGARPSDDTTFIRTTPSRAWRGMHVVALPDEQEFESVQGVQIEKIAPETPAAEAGLQPGDIIHSIGGREIHSVEDFHDATRAVNGRVMVRSSRGFIVVQEE